VVDASGRLAGIFTDGDVRRMLVSGQADLGRPVAGYMTSTPRTARSGTSAAEVLDLMEERGITVIPVVDTDDRLAGMVHLHDLLGKGRLKFSAGKGS
jgi:arabinose-5-phosphate isomerase